MKIKDTRKLKKSESQKKVTKLESELIRLQGQSATGTPPKSPGQIKQIKRLIARLKTLQREEEILSIKAGVNPEEPSKTTEVN